MRNQVEITAGFPSAAKAARRLGVSKKVAKDLSSLAERSLKTGEFVLPGVGRLVRLNGGTGARRKSAKTRFRVTNALKDTIVPSRKH
jgi:hypothetical protein